MILNRIKTGPAYERLAYLEGQIFSEIEPLFFSISRFSSGTTDPDTLMYTSLAIVGLTATIGVVGALGYYFLHDDKKHPVIVTNEALDATIGLAGQVIDITNKAADTTTDAIRKSGKSLSDRFR